MDPSSSTIVKDYGKLVQIGRFEADSLRTDAVNAKEVHFHSSDRILHPFSLDKFVSTVPQNKVAHHVERLDLRERLAAQLHANRDIKTRRSLVSVLYGLGGAGKTQAVLDYIEHFGDDYRGIFWIDVGSRQLAEESIRTLYRTIHNIPVLVGKNELQTDELVREIKTWFSTQQDLRLLVFDNADQAVELEKKEEFSIGQLIPSAPSVHAIITSRYSRMADLSKFTGIEVDGMEPKQALKLFYSCAELDETELSDENRKVAETIVGETERLALAVELAGTAVRKVESYKDNLEEYLRDFRSNRGELLVSEPGLGSQYSKSILAAWETTYHQLNRNSPLAGNLLGFLSVLDRTNITMDLFKMALECEDSRADEKARLHPWQSTLFGDLAPSAKVIEQALHTLRSFSMMTYDRSSRIYTMHKLVHDWGFQRMNERIQRDICIATMDFLVADILEGFDDPVKRASIMLHVTSNFNIWTTMFSKISNIDQERVLKNIRSYSKLAYELGNRREAIRIARFLLEALRKYFGYEHLYSVVIMADLTLLLQDNNQFDESELVLTDALKTANRLMGDDDDITLRLVFRLATIFGRQGHDKAALEIKRDILERMIEKHGKENEDTLYFMHQLGQALEDQGHFEEAKDMMQEVVSKRQLVLGEDHRDTISATNSLGLFLKNRGYLEEAAEMLRNTVSKSKLILGETQGDTLVFMNNLATTLFELGAAVETAQIRKEILDITIQTQGENHFDSIQAKIYFALALVDQGYLEKAAKMVGDLLDHVPHIFDAEDLRRFGLMRSFVVLLLKLDDLEDAARIGKEVLENHSCVLGEDHPDSLGSMGQLGNILELQGNLEDAVEIYKRCLQKRVQILGEDHWSTILEKRNLARALFEIDDPLEATKMYQEVLSSTARVYGEDNPKTIDAMGDLAVTLEEQGLDRDAIPLLHSALEKARRVLQNEHPIRLRIQELYDDFVLTDEDEK